MIELLNNISIDDPKSLLRSYQHVHDHPLVSNKVKHFLKKLLRDLLHLLNLFSSKGQLTSYKFNLLPGSGGADVAHLHLLVRRVLQRQLLQQVHHAGGIRRLVDRA
uniref:Uncharacterized protein n=1 Tax=Triticum urartu TaxID=4572 RepID=A0A8R7RCI3_TRIUA